MDTEECKVCSGEMPLFNGRGFLSTKCGVYPGIEVWIETGKMDITAVADTYEPNYAEISVPIRFCPVCGQRIEEE